MSRVQQRRKGSSRGPLAAEPDTRRVADYINVLWKGRIIEAGPAEEMLNSENPFIRQFLSGESQGPLAMD